MLKEANVVQEPLKCFSERNLWYPTRLLPLRFKWTCNEISMSSPVFFFIPLGHCQVMQFPSVKRCATLRQVAVERICIRSVDSSFNCSWTFMETGSVFVPLAAKTFVARKYRHGLDVHRFVFFVILTLSVWLAVCGITRALLLITGRHREHFSHKTAARRTGRFAIFWLIGYWWFCAARHFFHGIFLLVPLFNDARDVAWSAGLMLTTGLTPVGNWRKTNGTCRDAIGAATALDGHLTW